MIRAQADGGPFPPARHLYKLTAIQLDEDQAIAVRERFKRKTISAAIAAEVKLSSNQNGRGFRYTQLPRVRG